MKRIILSLFILPQLATFAANNPPPTSPTDLAVITNWGDDTCAIIDTTQEIPLNPGIKVGAKPYDVKVESTGRFAYVSCSGESFISVIDLQANLENENRRIPVGMAPRDIALTSDNNRLISANSGDDTISIVDVNTKQRVFPDFPVGNIPYGVALSKDDKTAVITLWGSNKALILSIGPNGPKIEAELPIGQLPYTAVMAGDDKYALITCFGSHAVYVIDLTNKAVLPKPVNVGRSPWGLSVSADGTSACVANFYDGTASVLNIDKVVDPLGAATPVKETTRFKLEKDDPIGGGTKRPGRAKNSAHSFDPNKVLMSDLAKNQVMVLNIKEQKVERVIKVGMAPYGIAFIPRKQ